MLKNYFKIAWRNLIRHKSYTLINLVGLAVAMACCILIALYVREELSYDTFHEKSDRIIAVISETSFFGRMQSTPYPLADALADEIPEVEQAVRINSTAPLNLSRDGQTYIEIDEGRYTEPGFFEVFSFDLVQGNPAEVLAAPNSIVLTGQSSEQLFGTEDPIGQSLYWQQRDTVIVLEVTGIVEAAPRNSSIQYGALVSFNTLEESRRSSDSWNAYSHQTYALLNSPGALATMPERLQALVDAHYEKREGSDASRSFVPIPMTELHLSDVTQNEGFTGNSAYLYLFGSVALFILLIACVNYVNLATARSSLRSKEVGVRKTLGAQRMQVAGQFLGESVILSLGAYVLGIGISLLVLPYFNQVFGTGLEWQNSGIFLIQLILAMVLVGFLAGIYPAMHLSRFSPLTVLRNRWAQGGSGLTLRKLLVVMQFAIALVLIIGSMVVYRQLQYTQNKDLGFDGEQVVSVSLPTQQAWRLRESIRSKLMSYPGIMEASVASGSPGRFNVRFRQKAEDLSAQAGVDGEETIMFAPAVVDYSFLEVLDIEVLAGRNFSRDMGSDVDRAYLINKKGAELLGWTPDEAVGKPFGLGNEGEIIGVVEDFHISSLHNEMEAVLLQLHESSRWSGGGTILAKLAPDQMSTTMDAIRTELAKYAPSSTFSYGFLDDRFDAMYRTERRLGQIVAMFTFIAIVITCMGLYGLAAFSAERRVKEIGIRKVLGATVVNIVGLLSKDFLKLVALGFIIAAPIAWYAMQQWLADFAYRIELGPDVFLVAGGAALAIALATVSWQAVRAALANPVESLRSE
jgi:putative ABC transport system permease protein